MHGVPFIRFSELNAKRYSEFMQDDAPDEISHSMARVFRREQIASICGMTEPQFIEWCLLSGNDFTASFDISDFDGLECEGIVEKDKKGNLKKKDDGYSRVKERSGDAKRIIKARGKDFRLNSSNPKLKMAIEFSRDFYELRDLSKYPIDPPDEEVQLVSLTAGDCAAITHWIDTHLKTRKLMTLQGVGVIGWTLMREMYCSQTDDSPAIDLLENVTPIHLNALERMLQQPHHHDPDYQFKHPNWHDLMFTHYYQLVCKFLLKHSRINLHHDSTEYHQIFNAELFYNLLEDETLKSAMGNLSIEPSNKSKTDSKKKIAKNDSSPKKSRQTPLKSDIQPAAAPQQKVAPSDLQEAKPVAKEKKVSNNSNPVVSDRKLVANDTLPIDAYLDEILYRIDRDRVTIIQGETGCGKSSRIPVMLLEDSQRRGVKCRMMVSQPRRIAASSLMKRVRSTLGMQVGLRMGHGIKDESDDTNIFFVTTGYLVRLLAFKPDAFRSHTHLIVDEVHERSIDGDVLCFLVKQLLTSNPNIRIVLMSATIHTDLYASYFSDSEEYYGDMKALSVGLRRFPIIINHIEDLQHLKQGKPEVGLLIKKIGETCNRLKGNSDPGIQFPKDQYAMVQHIIESRAVMGTGVLVFVAGMSDITDLQERFISFAHFDLYAIHSDIPFEEQESAFAPTPPNKIKIVIATNAAESSITLPDVDIVICLGMHKHITYDPITHRSLLQKTFISKASATQRAGRTGRVRPGEVYRIYSRKLFESFSDFETSEVLRTPLQETILSIRIMLEASPTFQGVIPVLEQLIEPPDTRNVENSFQYLYENGLISSYDDTGYLTPTGKLIGALPVGIALGRLIAYGVQLGVGEDAAKLAIALSQPKSPFRIASPIIHTDPKVYNDIVQTIFLSSHKFDRGQYSEPLMLLNLLTEWRKLRTERERERWAFHSGVVYARMRYFDSASSHLCTKLRQIVNSAPEENILTEKQRLNFLRLILAWTSEENILRMKPHRYSPSELTTLTITDKLLSPDQIESLFPSDDCLWQCNILAEVSYALPLKCNHLIDLGVDSSIRIFNAILSSKSQHTVSWIRVITPKHKVDYVTLHQEDEVNYNLLTENLHVIPANDIDVIQHEQQYITLQIKVDGNKKRIKQLNLLRETLSSFVYLILQPNHFV
jgi:HrpA-like RNA helicase